MAQRDFIPDFICHNQSTPLIADNQLVECVRVCETKHLVGQEHHGKQERP